MPGKVKVKIISGRNLPVMDRSSDTTDAYVEIKLGSTTYKTDVCRKSLHPQWNSDWYRFELDDAELQDEPLQIRLMDHDTYSANDAIGKVYLDLNPLLLPSAGQVFRYGLSRDGASNHDSPSNSVMSGWIPVYDTMHGIRGEVNILVKVELFSDFNRFRQSSCGVQFFCSPSVPQGYYAPIVHGFVEELVVNDDPEYQWIDKIRTPRASNEARQTLFFKLSRELQRKIGVKALDLGGNAVVGYRQCFDLEGESGIVARGIGTAVTLVKIMDMLHSVVPETNEECAQNYLKFLGSHASFSLATELKDPVLNQYIKKYNAPRFTTLYPPSPSSKRRHSPHMDEIRSNYSLKSLLEQEERRGTPGSGISQRIKNLKHSSHNMLSKKMTALKAKLGDGIEETSEMNPDNLKRRSPFPFKRTVSESNVMATVLARSVIQAHNSLGSILEKQHSPSLEIGVVEKPLEGVAESDTEQHLTAKGSLSDPFLFTDVESKDDQLSIDSELSESSSSGDDDEDEDSVGKGSDSELDTLSIIVKNVEIIERRKLTRQFSLPIYAHEESYCEDVSRGSNEISLMSSTSYNNANASQATSEALEKEGDNENENDVPNECDTKEKPSSKASSKSPKLKREKCFNLESCTNDDEDVENEISLESANTDDSLEKTKILHELQLPVPHLSEKKTIIPPIMLGANIPKKSLMKTAMATMLLEKVNIIGTYTPPVSPVSKSQEFKLNLSGPSSQYSSQVPSVTSSRSSMFSKRNSIAHDQQLNYLLSRSLTTSSLSKMNHKRDTVLGVPFMSLSNIRRQISHPCFQTGIFETEEVHANIASQQRSPTCFSDSELHRPVQRDNTKETPFERFPVGNITRQYRNRSPCFSDTILHKRVDNLPNREYVASQDNINKNKDTFLSLLQKDTEADPLSLSKTEIATCSKSPELPSKLDKKRGLSFYKKLGSFMKKLHKTSNLKDKSTSVSDLKQSKFSVWSKMSLDNITLKNTRSKSTSVVSPIFQKHTKVKSSTAENNFKKHGLVGTALGNVVMETVQDILATSHPDKNKSEVKHESGDAKSMVVAKCDVSSTSLTSAQVSPVPSLFSAPSHGIATPVPTTPNLTTTNTTDKCNESNAAKYSTNDASVNMKIDNDASLNNENNKLHASLTPSARNNSSPQPDQHQESGHHRVESVGTKILASPAKLNSVPCIHRRSSDSDLSITPKGNSLTGSDRSCGGSTGHFVRNNVMLRSTVPQENFEMLEYPFLTMSKYPPGFIVQLGGAVFARSVKLLERITNLEEPESRDTWWSELRMEIRSHARALNCNAVLGYTETTSICEDVCVLSASGTAAVIGFHYTGELGDSVAGLPSFVPKHHGSKDKDMMTTSADRTEFDKDKPVTKESKENANVPAKGTSTTSPEHDQEPATKKSCAICHLPYNTNNIRVTAVASKCAVCKAAKVPEVLITTIEMPDGIQTVGRGCFIQSAACRSLRDAKSESNAKEISDGLPFLEYELHRLLVNKLRIKAMNSIFGLKITISVGEKMLIGVATGTASFIAALPAPFIPQLVSDRLTGQRRLAELQKELTEVVRRNIEVYQLKEVEESTLREQITSDNDDSEEDQSALELSVGNKDCCLLEIDDPEDVELVQLLIEGIPPDGFHVVNTEFVPGLEELEIVKNLQMFTQIYRAKLPPPYNLNEHFYRCLQTLFFKLRRMVPCALCDVQFRVDIPEVEELQITVVGMALGLGDPQKNKGKRKNPLTKRNEEDMIFNLDEDQVLESNPNQNYLHSQSAKFKPKSPMKLRSLHVRHIPYRERHGVDITPLSYVPGGKIERYLGNLNFFFIRETTSIREEGGLSGFIHSFATEVLAIVRAHVTALGGNAMVAYFMTECIINHSLHKNQGQCLINVGGDVVYVSYFNEDA